MRLQCASVTFFLYLIVDIEARCLHGSEPDCYFPCNCAVPSECEQGICPSGCGTNTGVYNVPWRGPACQIGNVAFRKPCQHHGNASYHAALAVDGRPQTDVSNVTRKRRHEYCSHQLWHGLPIDDPSDPAWWVVDLGEVHKIYNVTIYGRNHCDEGNPRCAERLSNFIIRVGLLNTYTNGQECGRHDQYVPLAVGLGGHVTVTCTMPLIGTHVYFVRTGGFQVGVCSLCEVIAIGHKYVDCSSVGCDPENCNDVTGCDACSGAYLPDCIQECDPGYFGINCAQVCDKCADEAPCDRINGLCPRDCQLWWTDAKCNTYVASPEVTQERALIERSTNESVVLEWEPLTSIPTELTKFYKYSVNFRESSGNYQDGPFFPHQPSTLSHTFTHLAHNTVYDFTVVTYRVMGDTEEAGESYSMVSAKTKCNEPTIQKVSIVPGAGGDKDLGTIMIIHDNIDSGCDEITVLWLAFRHDSDLDFARTTGDPSSASSSIKPGRSGEYTVKIIVVNNEGLSTTSPPQTVTVIETRRDPPTTTRIDTVESSTDRVIIIAVAVVLVVVVGVVVIIVTVLVLRHKRFQHTNSREDMTATTGDVPVKSRVQSVLQGEGEYETVGLETLETRPAGKPYEELRRV